MSRRQVGEHHPPHPRWRPEWPPGSVILGQAEDGRSICLPPEMRKLGLQIVGLPNQGKSKMMENMARQDILALCGTRRSVIFIDPHGPSYAALLNWIVTHGIDRLVPVHLLDLSDPDYLFHLNPLKRRGTDPAVPAAAVTSAILKGVWSGQDPTAMPQCREALKITFATCAEYGAPLVAASELLELDDTSGARAYAAYNSANPVVRAFWRTVELHKPRERDAMLGSARRRLNEFLLPRRTREIFSEAENVIDWRTDVMDAGAVVLVNLNYDTGNVSEDEATTVGALILNDIFLACRGRAADAIRTYVYVDECHRFATEDTARLFTEARKFNCHPVLAHQIFEQLEQAGSFIKGSIMSARNKIFFGGLPPDEAEWAARFAYRGQFDLEKVKHVFDKPVVVDHETLWLQSESEGRGSATAAGRTWSEGGEESRQRSTTETHGTTLTETDSESSSETLSNGYSFSEGHTDSFSGNRSDGDTSSASTTRSGSSAQGYDQTGAIGGPTLTDGWSASDGYGSTHTTGVGWGSADSTSLSHSTASAYTTATAHATSTAVSDSTAFMKGTTKGANWSEGGSTTRTESTSQSHGRSQTLKPILKTMPSQGYPLAELVEEAAADIAALPAGTCVVKIGTRPAEKVSSVRVREGWARPEHIDRAKARLAAQSRCVVRVPETAIGYAARPRALLSSIVMPQGEPAASNVPDEPSRVSPPLKDEGWG